MIISNAVRQRENSPQIFSTWLTDNTGNNQLSQFLSYFSFFHCRERFLNFICSLELNEDIHIQSAYNMLKENLVLAQMLIYVHTFNLSNTELELNFVLGNKDMEQWQVRSQEYRAIEQWQDASI